MSGLTSERLRQVLAYDPATGIFVWRNKPRGRDRTIAGTQTSHGYIQISVDGKLYPAHRLAWLYVHGAWPKGEIDHIDGARANNAATNLRDATHSQNLANQKLSLANTSGFKGVCFNKERNRWVAYIKVLGRRRHLGRFKTPEAAHEAYRQAAVEAFGAFARPGAPK
jgi:hypothetical protein